MRVELTQEVDTVGGRMYAHPGSPFVIDVPPTEAKRLVDMGVGHYVDPVTEPAEDTPRRREVDRRMRGALSR